MRAERLRARGVASGDQDAAALARRRFGDVVHIRDECVAIDQQTFRHQRTADLREA